VKSPIVVAFCVALPESWSDPLQDEPLAPPPLAVHPVAPLDDQFSVKDWPWVSCAVLVVRFTPGGPKSTMVTVA